MHKDEAKRQRARGYSLLPILSIGAERAVEDQCQEWRLRHRARRAKRALDGDLARFNAGSPGGWQFLQGARRVLALRRPAICSRHWDLERADAAVARRA
jgi:hypothetical protein